MISLQSSVWVKSSAVPQAAGLDSVEAVIDTINILLSVTNFLLLKFLLLYLHKFLFWELY